MTIDAPRLQRSLWPVLDAVAQPQPLTELDLNRMLEQLLQAAVDVLEVSGAGIVLLDSHDRPQLAAATDPASRALEQAQVDSVEGPGIDAMTGSITVAVQDLGDSVAYVRLWDAIAPTGVRAVLSSPVRIGESVVGTFVATTRSPHAWTVDQVRTNEAFAHVVGLALLTSSLRAAHGSYVVAATRSD